MSIYKLDCEYTLEEAKNVDANDITTHPFFKKHFATSNSRPGAFSSTLYVKPDKEQDHVIHYITHTPLDPHHESNIDHSKHAVKIETQHYGRTKHIGHGRGMTVHEAMDNAVHTYTHPLKIKPLTESLVGKKPATASKLFAEGMEARLDELSKKTLGRYIERAVVDRDRHIEDATRARASVDALNNVRADSDAASQTKRSLRSFLGDQERTAHNKKYKRETGILKALNRLTKEDLDEEQLNEISKKTLGKYTKKAITNRDDLHAEANHLEHLGDQMSLQKNADWFYDKSAKLRKKYVNRTIGINKAIDRLTKEDLDEVEAPANFWNAGMARMNPIQVSQKQSAEPGQFKATLTKSPKRLADQDSSLEGKPRAVRDETEATAASRGPKTIELTGDWHADVPDHQFDPKLDSETEYYPLFSQFKSLGAYPSGPARAWESEEIDEDELNEISKELVKRYSGKAQANLSRHADEVDKLGAKADYHHDRAEHYIHNLKSGDREKFLKHQTTADTLENKISKEHSIIRKREKGLNRATKKLSEDELNEISKKTLAKYIRGASTSMMAAGIGIAKATPNSQEQEKEARKISKRVMGIDRATKKLSEEGKKKPAEFKKLHDKHETEVKSKMKELVEEALQEGLFDPAKQPLLALWDEHARRSDAHGSGSRTEILKRIEDHVAKKHGQEGLKKMRLHSDLSNALKKSMSGDKGHLQALLNNMRAKCAMEQ